MLSLFSLFHALFMFFDDEKHNFMMNGNLVPMAKWENANDFSINRKMVKLKS